MLTLILLFNVVVTSAFSAEKKGAIKYEDDDVYMRLIIRSNDQLSAFYQGREFKQAAIDKILQTCFITPIVKNKRFDVLWLDMDHWQFESNGKLIQRIKRDYWKKQWKQIGLQQAHQSTFGWTLMPELRDLRKDEGVGGSIVLPAQQQSFNVIAKFNTGRDKKGKVKVIRFEGIKCP